MITFSMLFFATGIVHAKTYECRITHVQYIDGIPHFRLCDNIEVDTSIVDWQTYIDDETGMEIGCSGWPTCSPDVRAIICTAMPVTATIEIITRRQKDGACLMTAVDKDEKKLMPMVHVTERSPDLHGVFDYPLQFDSQGYLTTCWETSK